MRALQLGGWTGHGEAEETLSLEAWRERIVVGVRAGGRVVALFGRPGTVGPEGAEVVLTALMESAAGLEIHRASGPRAEGYPALSGEYPALQAMERELHEQLGLRLPGHPWLKPLRFEGAGGQSAMDAYPWHTVEGKEVHEVAVGPVHAGVIEPGSFRFMCHGEDVLHLEIHLGYQHRGVERLLLERAHALGERWPRLALPLVETISGDSSVAHSVAFCLAVEALAREGAGSADPAGWSDPAGPVALSRAVLLELERVGMHLAGLAGMATDIAHLQAASTYGRLRTVVINTTMALCGSRFGRGGVRPGGCGYALDRARRDTLRAALDLLERDLPVVDDRFLADPTVLQRLRRVGTVDRARALEIGMVGMSARASGVAVDQRRGGVYAAHPVTPVVLDGGDCLAREALRAGEIQASLAWLRGVLRDEPEWAADRTRTPLRLAPWSLGVGVVEGWRGETLHVVETGANGDVVHVKVQDPSLRNWMGLAIAVRGNGISDFPLCNKSFDLSYCGHDL